jgi:DNA-directed RNA polymerase specialized sigma54-like protein
MEKVLKKNGNTALYWYERALNNQEPDEKIISIADSIITMLKSEGYFSSRAEIE